MDASTAICNREIPQSLDALVEEAEAMNKLTDRLNALLEVQPAAAEILSELIGLFKTRGKDIKKMKQVATADAAEATAKAEASRQKKDKTSKKTKRAEDDEAAAAQNTEENNSKKKRSDE